MYGQPQAQPENIMPLPPILGDGDIKKILHKPRSSVCKLILFGALNMTINECNDKQIDRARFDVPPNTGFYGSNDPTNSVKAHDNTTTLQYETKTHKISTDKHK